MNDHDSVIFNGLKADYRVRLVQEKELYKQYSYFIEEGCKKYKLTYEDSFSAYSDAVLSAIHNIISDKFDGNSSLKTYLFRIFSNKCVDLLRKNTTNKQEVNQSSAIPELLSQLKDNARDAVEKMIDAQNRSAIKTNLESIGQKCREILLMFEDGLSDKQIAEELAYNNAAVAKTSRLRCLEKLKEKVLHFVKAM